MLYIPPHFRESDVAVLQAQIRAIGFGSLTTIVNCAGIVQVRPLHELDEALLDHLPRVSTPFLISSVNTSCARSFACSKAGRMNG